MLRPQLRLCRMAWVRGEGRESNKATNIYEIGHNNMKRTNLHTCTHDCTRMETTKYNGYNHCATKPVHRRSDDNVTKHKTQLLNTGSTKLQENNATTLELPLNYRKCRTSPIQMKTMNRLSRSYFGNKLYYMTVLADTDADGTRI